MLTDRVAAIAATKVPAALMSSTASEPFHSSEMFDVGWRELKPGCSTAASVRKETSDVPIPSGIHPH